MTAEGGAYVFLLIYLEKKLAYAGRLPSENARGWPVVTIKMDNYRVQVTRSGGAYDRWDDLSENWAWDNRKSTLNSYGNNTWSARDNWKGWRDAKSYNTFNIFNAILKLDLNDSLPY